MREIRLRAERKAKAPLVLPPDWGGDVAEITGAFGE
jgi:hypothetical protein